MDALLAGRHEDPGISYERCLPSRHQPLVSDRTLKPRGLLVRKIKSNFFIMRMVAAALVVVLTVGSACGGNGSDETASARAIEPEAQQRAESVNLTLADFPDGWRVAAPESDDDTGRALVRTRSELGRSCRQSSCVRCHAEPRTGFRSGRRGVDHGYL